MAALAGKPLSSLAETDRFLWDFRRAVLDLWANEYFGTYADFLHERGMLAYAEAYGHEVFDISQCSGRMDTPMAEWWWNEPRDDKPHTRSGGSYVNGASAANTYGRGRVACEAFSTNPNEAGWRNHPRAMKRLADDMFLNGINQIIFHAYPHQAYDTAPGLTLSVWGSQFGRLNTWWPLSRPWHEYLGRCQYLLRQGHSVSDFARHLGEEAPESPWLPGGVAPAGFRYDEINTEVILDSLAVRDGKLVLPHGAEYAALVVETRVMCVELARKLAELIRDGATLLCPKPIRSPGYANWREADAEIRRIADDVWGDCDGKAVREHRYGKGKVVWGKSLTQIVSESGLRPRVESVGIPLGWFHRRTQDADFFFVATGSDPFSGECLFRVDDRLPELWDPLTGDIRRPRQFETTSDGRTRVTLDLESDGSVWVVFRKNGPATLPLAVAPDAFRDAMEIKGPWEVSFQPGRGAPPAVRMDRLRCWTESEDPGIRYFSGIAVYRQTFEWSSPVPKDATIHLHLGRVADVARVRLNGREAGGVWTDSARLEITGLIRPGKNDIEIEVANRWINRLIGDEQVPDDAPFKRDVSFGSPGYALTKLPDWFPNLDQRPEKRRIGFPFFKHYTKDSPLVPSGLLGPVRIQTVSSLPRKPHESR